MICTGQRRQEWTENDSLQETRKTSADFNPRKATFGISISKWSFNHFCRICSLLAAPHCFIFIFIATALCLLLMVIGGSHHTMKQCALSLAQPKPACAVACTNQLCERRAGETFQQSRDLRCSSPVACLIFFSPLKGPRKHYPEALN